ncbi:cbb3-type cytochrome c oxidase subunit I, partial [Streptomyces sp. NRRL S-1896]|uniref:cbb3-type cytochrome c oxidase subunit I n=1 Tax=Streptomyces sp. NRRL S-1896 TaxID=1463893 RepID=UPI00056ABF87
VNFITTIICMRAPGMTMFRMPIFTWNVLLTSLLVLMVFPVLAAAPFRLVFRRNEVALRQERVHGSFPRDLRYEAEYAQALGVAYRRTKIFGLDELSRHDSEWD